MKNSVFKKAAVGEGNSIKEPEKQCRHFRNTLYICDNARN